MLIILDTFEIGRIVIKFHQFDSLIIATGGQQVSDRRPRHTIYRSFMMFRSLEQYRRLASFVIISAEQKKSNCYTFRKHIDQTPVSRRIAYIFHGPLHTDHNI